jgi:signal transduction histidine kinase
MRLRQLLGGLVAVMAVPTAVVLTPRLYLANAVPMAIVSCLAVATIVAWPFPRNWLEWPGAVSATVSLVATSWIVGTGATRPGESTAVGLLEVAGLLTFLVLVARWSPLRTAVPVGLLLAVAATGWLLRFMPETDLLSTIAGCIMWALGAAVAAAAGSYPRLAAARLQQSVVAARNSQRLQLAHDLHDFIAHDVTGMVAQAQAARFAAADDPVALRTALERIEVTGQEALSAMDAVVEMLRDGTDPHSGLRAAGLKGLPEIVACFQHERQDRTVVLTADESVLSGLAPDLQLAATRVVMEALTNIRRHAPTADLITVTVEARTDVLEVRVANGRPRKPRHPRAQRTSGGTGLTGLQERARLLGGRLEAGPDDCGGWIVQCELPIRTD